MRTRLASVAVRVAAAAWVWWAGCAGNPPRAPGSAVCATNCEPPDWCAEVGDWTDEDVQSVCGVSGQYRMERQARSSAELEAWRQALHNLGVEGRERVDRVLREVGSSSELVLDEATAHEVRAHFEARGKALGYVEKWHVERWELTRPHGVETYYVARALYRVPRAAVEDYTKGLLLQAARREKREEQRLVIEAAVERLDEMARTGEL